MFIRRLAVLVLVCFGFFSFCQPAGAQEAVRTIPFKISSRMWYEPEKKQIPTPPAIIEKITKAFELWGSVREAGLRFRYDGLVDADYAGFHQVPHDGTVYVVLNNWEMGQCFDGLGQYWGRLPGNYRGGGVVINTRKGIQTVRIDILAHEIGHALGLPLHAASPSGMMNEADHAWNIQEYLTLSEQDRADLTLAWHPESAGLFTISGRVDTSLPEQKTDENKMASVFAVNVVNGHAYSAKTDQDGRFHIALLKAGDYRVLAKPSEAYFYQQPAPQSPSWYVSDGNSTNDPYNGRVLRVDEGNRAVRDIVIKIIDRPVPFNLFRAGVTYEKGGPFCFMLPGGETRLQIEGKGMVSVEAYGTQPDYTLSDVELESHFQETTYVKVMVRADAEPGERLVIARGQPGDAVQAGLIGVNVVSEIPPRISSGSLQAINEQILGKSGASPAVPKTSGRILTWKPGEPLPPALSQPPKPRPAGTLKPGNPGRLFEGVSRTNYENGRPRLEVTYVQGRPQGPYRSYFPTGELESEGQYLNGEYDGILKTYFREGGVRLEEKYERGKRIYLREFDPAGELLKEHAFASP